MNSKASTISLALTTASLFGAILLLASPQPVQAHAAAEGVIIRSIDHIDGGSGISVIGLAHTEISNHRAIVDDIHIMHRHSHDDNDAIGNSISIGDTLIAAPEQHRDADAAETNVLQNHAGSGSEFERINTVIDRHINGVHVADDIQIIEQLGAEKIAITNFHPGIDGSVILHASIAHGRDFEHADITGINIPAVVISKIDDARATISSANRTDITGNPLTSHTLHARAMRATQVEQISEWDRQAEKDMSARITCEAGSCKPIQNTFGRNANWLPGWELRWWAFKWDNGRTVWVYHARSKSSGERHTSFVDPISGQLQNWESAQ